MKKSILSIVAILMLTFATQAQKLGHINAQEIMLALPDYEQASKTLEEFSNEMRKDFEYFATKYQEKETAYLKKEAECNKAPESCNKDLLAMDYQMLMESGQKLEAMQADIQTKVQQKQELLITEIVNKVKKAAQEVATEKGIIYVFDSSTLIVAGGEDLNEAVKTKLTAVKAP
jgi:outer membrane protein